MSRRPPSPPHISVPRVPFDFSSLHSSNGQRAYQQTAGPFYPPGDSNDIYSSGDDRDLPQNAPFQGNMGGGRPPMPPYPHGFANPYPQQRMPVFPSPFDLPSMGVFNPAAGGPSNFTQMQPQQKKRPKYTRSKAGCLTCRTKKIKVRLCAPEHRGHHLLMRSVDGSWKSVSDRINCLYNAATQCDEAKPVCTKCEHSQRECTWPTDAPKKKASRRVRQSTSPEEAGRPPGGQFHLSLDAAIADPT